MEEQELRNIVVATGPELLCEGLVARTWGNISARVDDTHYLITPSGMDYEKLTADDLVLCDRVRGTFEGRNRPSSERGVRHRLRAVPGGRLRHSHASGLRDGAGPCGLPARELHG